VRSTLIVLKMKFIHLKFCENEKENFAIQCNDKEQPLDYCRIDYMRMWEIYKSNRNVLR